MSVRKALVTGASRGIGLSICRRLVDSGAEVVGIARHFDARREDAPWTATIEHDLSDDRVLDGFAKRLASDHGDADAIILCAGAGRFAPLESLSAGDIRYLLNLNLLAPMILSRAFVPGFKKRRRGDIVFIGSEASHQPGPRGTAYCASKFGLRGFSLSLRIECAARGVRVSLVNPGLTDTNFYDSEAFKPGAGDNQHLRAEDIADAVSMVLSAPSGTVFDEINLTPATRVIDFGKRRDDDR
ncbi:MAG: SDR family NAD(P)-dependent oxidoreductase [Proteobacteria bacterium]|nr:MAG: SDR family NAD(P)-dependent oxidoreductase [Pseudomonadota bacterium]